MIIAESIRDTPRVDAPYEQVQRPIQAATSSFLSIPEVAELTAFLPEGCYVDRMDTDLGPRTYMGGVTVPPRTTFEIIDARSDRANPFVENALPKDKYQFVEARLDDYACRITVELLS